MSESWEPSVEDIRTGREAYVQYIGGVMLLHDPNSAIAQALIGNNEMANSDNALAIVRQAEEIMYSGLSAMIIRANPPRYRSPIDRAEHRFEEALPQLRVMVSAACESDKQRLDAISPAITVMRPMPLGSRGIYTAICHSRRGNIQTKRLLGPFMADPEFAGLLDARRLQGYSRNRHGIDPVAQTPYH